MATNEQKTESKPEPKKQSYRSLEAKSLRARPFLTRVSDLLTTITGTPLFLFLNVFFFAAWIAINLHMVPQIPAFDPFPFGLLTMIVSLEAIFLSIFVLISQNRSAYISTMRGEVNLKVNLIAEEEITKILELLGKVSRRIGVATDDELKEMLERTDAHYIERSIAELVERSNKPLMNGILKDVKDKFEDVMRKPVEVLIKDDEVKSSVEKAS